MRNIKVVIGANFGDEGKGLMTDYFCSQFPETKPVLNVRFNGGAQAGHTVYTKDLKKSHVFGHFGAGSFNPNVATYLGPDFIVNPILFRREYEELQKLGIYPLVYAHPRCLLTMPQDMMINQFIEKRRGASRHGSCGVGIYETLLRNQTDKPLYIKDFKYAFPRYQIDLGYYSSERIEKIFGLGLSDKELTLLSNQNIKAHFDQDLKFFTEHVSIADEGIYDIYDNVVFEGAQGLMLDQNNVEYFPHLTPSNTGIQNIAKHFSNKDNESIEVCYVSRTYLTRHGAGILPNECTREEIGEKIDLTNKENEWQGSLRYGKLDTDDLVKRVDRDFSKIGEFCLTVPCNIEGSIAITHADNTNLFLDIMRTNLNFKYISSGPSRMFVSEWRSYRPEGNKFTISDN